MAFKRGLRVELPGGPGVRQRAVIIALAKSRRLIRLAVASTSAALAGLTHRAHSARWGHRCSSLPPSPAPGIAAKRSSSTTRLERRWRAAASLPGSWTAHQEESADWASRQKTSDVGAMKPWAGSSVSASAAEMRRMCALSQSDSALRASEPVLPPGITPTGSAPMQHGETANGTARAPAGARRAASCSAASEAPPQACNDMIASQGPSYSSIRPSHVDTRAESPALAARSRSNAREDGLRSTPTKCASGRA